ncbi:MAG: NAD(P)(+) transhydrogenase (Re/Si-specific) subunit beta [Ignavibacteriaceae bacterium]|nr:NAD(P)(+) transhydrogenase (Re/Si-specific) subunit beta [Ignavibacteriaceae bacterium]
MEIREIIISLFYLIASFLFIFGIKRLSSPATARMGNIYSAIGMLIAVVATLLNKNIVSFEYILLGIVVGSAIGAYMALKVAMTDMPQMVGLLNGFGGGASAFVALSEFYQKIGPDVAPDIKAAVAISISLLIGSVTFTGSLIAFGKLQGIVTGKVVKFPLQNQLNILLILALITLIVLAVIYPQEQIYYLTIIGISLLVGVLLVLPIGGADMPVAISLLNSYSGMAAAATGFVIDNNMLIIAGSLVGASGIILTNIMCKAMNRSLMNVLLGGWDNTASSSAVSGGKDVVIKSVDSEEAASIFDAASSVIVVPGYGMAVAQAQHAVKELMDVLEKRGISVKFAVHPVAGRMPGHMNILLAESNVPYDKLYALEDINDDFKTTDVSLVIGANDVVNPAARSNPESPIYGMPILNVDYSRTVIVVKRSMAAGYAGIDNDLFGLDNTFMYFGDAKDAITKLNNELKNM